MRLSRRGGRASHQPKMPSHRVRLQTAGVATDHRFRAGTAGWRAAGTTVHATLAQAGVSFRGALGLGPSRGQHLRTELLAGAAWVPGNLVLHVHGSGQSPRTCVHPENRVAPMERNRGLMGRLDRRMGRTCSKRTGRDRTRNRTVHVAGRGPARAERAAVASMESWSTRGIITAVGRNAGKTETAVRSLVSRAREGTAGQLPVKHLWVAIAWLAVGHPARPRLGKPGRECREVTGVAWCRRCRALTGRRRRPQERQRRRGRSARSAPMAQRASHYAVDDLAATARRGRLLPPQLFNRCSRSTRAASRPPSRPS